MKGLKALCVFVVFVANCARVRAAAGDAEILDLQFDKPVLNVGEKVQLTCRIRNSTRHHTLSFYKQARNPTNSTMMWYILSNTEEPYYPHLDYVFTFAEEGAIDRYIMTIPKAELTTSGNYLCAVRSTSLQSYINQTAQLSVITEPTSVKLYVDGTEVVPYSRQTFSLSSEHNLQCIANGSNPPAMLELWHGNQDLSRLVTNRTDGEAVYGPLGDPSLPFLASITRSSTAAIRNWRVDVTYQDEPLRCSAKAYVTSPKISVEFTPTVLDGPPHFVCNDTYKLPINPDTDTFGIYYDVSCIVVSKPALTNVMFGCETEAVCKSFTGYPINSWHPTDDTVYSGIVQNANPDDMQSTDIVKGRVTLKIRMPRDAINNRKFTFKASNVKGVVIHQVQLLGASKLFSTSAAILASVFAFCLISLQYK
jgi:hypothetical protein